MTDERRAAGGDAHSARAHRFSAVAPGRRRPRLELLEVTGEPSSGEIEAIEEALEKVVEQERAATASSLWLRAARSQGRRLGMMDYRDRFSREDAWRLSTRFPFGGREYSGRHGRGDTK